MPEKAEELTYTSKDWQRVAEDLVTHAGTDQDARYPPDLKPYGRHLYDKATDMDRRVDAGKPPDGRFTETLSSRDAGYVRQAAHAVGAQPLPSTPQ